MTSPIQPGGQKPVQGAGMQVGTMPFYTKLLANVTALEIQEKGKPNTDQGRLDKIAAFKTLVANDLKDMTNLAKQAGDLAKP